MATTFQGRYGQELLEHFIQPILDGYYYWDTHSTSEAMWPLTCQLLAGPTLTLPDGLRELPKQATNGCSVLLSHETEKIVRRSDGTHTVTIKHGSQTKTLQFDGIVCATTATVARKIVKGLSRQQRNFLSSVSYSSTVILARTYSIPHPPENQAIAYPRKDGSPIAAITISTAKDVTVAKTFASGATGQALVKKSDDAIRTLLSKTAQLPSTFNAPSCEYIQRWPEALPNFNPQHLEQLRYFADGKVEAANGTLVFAGDYIGGPFMEGAFTSGAQAAERLDAQLRR